MDRTQLCGSCNVGSIPAESTNTKNSQVGVFSICALGVSNLLCLRQESKDGALIFSAEKIASRGREIFLLSKRKIFVTDPVESILEYLDRVIEGEAILANPI